MLIQRHIIAQSQSIIEALAMLNALSGNAMTLFVVGPTGVMTGTLTDGDIRRGLLAGALPSWPVEKVMNRRFSSLCNDMPDLNDLRSFRQRGIRLIPCLDHAGHIARIIDTSLTNTILPIGAILMAGGRGERLRPLTLTTPKPLLPIAGKPIIDYNIEALARVGITDITVTVNYLAEQLEKHFAEPVAGVDVKCVRESMPLGTIGAAALADIAAEGDTLVMNSDLLTSVSFEDMYLTHKAMHADITIAAIPYNVSVPYAILELEGQQVTALREKPSYAYYANAGIYMISNRLLRNLPADTRTDATDLIESAIADGLKVIYHPLTGTWIDIGAPADYARACEIMSHRTLHI